MGVVYGVDQELFSDAQPRRRVGRRSGVDEEALEVRVLIVRRGISGWKHGERVECCRGCEA